MSGESDTLREFVGFVWPDDDFTDKSGVLVMARTIEKAAKLAREAFGDDFRLSLWNEEEAAKLR